MLETLEMPNRSDLSMSELRKPTTFTMKLVLIQLKLDNHVIQDVVS